MKIDHIGYLVKNIETSINEFLKLGYEIHSELFFDNQRNVRIIFLFKENYKIELIEPVEEKAHAYNLLKKNGNMPYHICYSVEEIEKIIEELKKEKYILLEPLQTASALDEKRVCFMYHNHVGIIELVEK